MKQVSMVYYLFFFYKTDNNNICFPIGHLHAVFVLTHLPEARDK